MQFIKKIIIAILTIESRLILKKYKPFIVAVTGSVGKTATKDAIFCALSSLDHVRKSEKSLNSEIGLPLTIIGVPNAWKSLSGWMSNIEQGVLLIIKKSPYPKVLVLEIGADHPGDIKKVVKWLKPDIGVITKVGDKPVHVEFFKSPLQVFEEKSALVRAIKPGGTAVIFADESKIVALSDELKQKNIAVITTGISDQAQIRGLDYRINYEEVEGNTVPAGFSFSLQFSDRSDITKKKDVSISMKNIIGQTYMYPLLTAFAVAQVKGIDADNIIKNITTYVAPKGRMNVIKGKNNSTIIDDTYNSSPDAVCAGLDALKILNCKGKKIAILGDMMELGSYSSEQHRAVGKNIIDVANILVTVGPRARAIADEAVKCGMSSEGVACFSTAEEAGDFVASLVTSGDVIFIKGSQSVRMERATKILMEHPEEAGELLVRQEKEWLEKK